MKELKTKIEEYEVPPKSRIYRDRDYYDEMKRGVLKMKDS